jgi:hypothetical protein
MDEKGWMLTQYEHELELQRQRLLFEHLAIECPECFRRAILPPNDYLCEDCRDVVRGTRDDAQWQPDRVSELLLRRLDAG